MTFESREYRPGDAVPRSSPAPEPYKDRGAAGIGPCDGCGRNAGRKKIEHGGQTQRLCNDCASKARREASKTADEAANNPRPPDAGALVNRGRGPVIPRTAL